MNKNIFHDNSNKNIIRPVSTTIIKNPKSPKTKKISITRKKTESINRDRVASSVFYDYNFRTKTKSLSPSMTEKNLNSKNDLYSKIENNEVLEIVNKAIKEEKKFLNKNNFQNNKKNFGNFQGNNLINDQKYVFNPNLKSVQNLQNFQQVQKNKEKYIKMSKSVDNISLNSAIVENIKIEIIINNSLQNLENIKTTKNPKKFSDLLKKNLLSIKNLFFDIKKEKLKMQEIINLQKDRLVNLTFNPIVPNYIKNPDLLKDLHNDVIILMEAYDKLYMKYNNKKNGMSNLSMNDTVRPDQLQKKLNFLKNNIFNQNSKNENNFNNISGNNFNVDFPQNKNEVKFAQTENLQNLKNNNIVINKNNNKRFTFFAGPIENNNENPNYETSQSTNYLKHLQNQNLIKNLNYENNLNSSEKNSNIKMQTVNPSDFRLKPSNFEEKKISELKNQITKLKKNAKVIMEKLNSLYSKNSAIKIKKNNYESMKKELIILKKVKDRYLNDNLKLNSEYGEVLENLEISQNNLEELKLAYKIMIKKINKKNNEKKNNLGEFEKKEVLNYEEELDIILEEIPEFLKIPKKKTLKSNLQKNRKISSERNNNVEITTNLFQLSDYKNKYKKLLGDFNSLKKKDLGEKKKNEKDLSNSKLENYYKKMVEDLQNEKKILFEKVLKSKKKNKILLEKIKGEVEDKTDFVNDLIEVIDENKNIIKNEKNENSDKKDNFDLFVNKINKKIRHFSFAIKNDVFLFKGEKNEKIEKFEEKIKNLENFDEMSENEKNEFLKDQEEQKKNLDKKNLDLMNSEFFLDTPLNSKMNIEKFNNSKVFNEKKLKATSSNFFLDNQINSSEKIEEKNFLINENFQKSEKLESLEKLESSEKKIFDNEKKKSSKKLIRYNTEIINKKNKEIDNLVDDLHNKIKSNNINGILNEKMIDMFIEKLEILRNENKETWEKIKNSEKEIFNLEKKNDELFRSNFLLTVILENRNTVVSIGEKQNLVLIDFIKKLKNKKLGKEELKIIFLEKIDGPCDYLNQAREKYEEVFKKIKKQYQI